LPITELRETPIAAAIWLHVMPLPTQLRSCSMRSAVQVPVEVATLFGAGATIAGSIAEAVGAIGGIGGDPMGSDDAMDGDMERPRLLPRPVWAAARAFVRAQRATARKRNLEAKIGARL
jgi:hypothetical protein